jgi:hypothetical protein
VEQFSPARSGEPSGRAGSGFDETAVSAAMEAFRYERFDPAESGAWLENRGLTFDDFSE